MRASASVLAILLRLQVPPDLDVRVEAAEVGQDLISSDGAGRREGLEMGLNRSGREARLGSHQFAAGIDRLMDDLATEHSQEDRVPAGQAVRGRLGHHVVLEDDHCGGASV
jgi:hypothetical protein